MTRSRSDCRELAEDYASDSREFAQLGEWHKARFAASLALAYSNMALDPERPRQ